jgi:hypothetical protein
MGKVNKGIMFKDILRQFSGIPHTEADLFVDTKNIYDVTLTAILLKDGWYALARPGDFSRVHDIDKLIADEFEASVDGWVTKTQIATSFIPFEEGATKQEQITYCAGSGQPCYWLLR